MKEHFHVPLDSIVRSVAWLNSPFAFRNVCDVINSEFVHMTVEQLEQFWNSITPFWTLPEYEQLGLKCYELKESVSIAKEFLLFQFNGDDDEVAMFLKTFCDVMNSSEI